MMRLTAQLINRTAAAVRFFYSSLRPAGVKTTFIRINTGLLTGTPEFQTPSLLSLTGTSLSNQVGKNAKMPSVQVRKNVKTPSI